MGEVSLENLSTDNNKKYCKQQELQSQKPVLCLYPLTKGKKEKNKTACISRGIKGGKISGRETVFTSKSCERGRD